MSPFIPNLSAQAATLRDLLKKDAEFNWNTSHDTAFEASKALVCREVTLAYFVPGADTVVQVDASGRGLGTVLLQGGKPMAFASKSLSECEKRYANIEREMLAVVFGCEHFHTYVYGTRFTVESDHKPLDTSQEPCCSHAETTAHATAHPAVQHSIAVSSWQGTSFG